MTRRVRSAADATVGGRADRHTGLRQMLRRIRVSFRRWCRNNRRAHLAASVTCCNGRRMPD